MLLRRSVFPALAVLASVAALPAPAEAQFYLAGYFGVNHTQPATVTVAVPAVDLIKAEYEDVHFDAKPFESPQYYGWRTGYLFGKARRMGVELEFIHLKVIADTSRIYAGSSGLPMSLVVQRYSMTHGLNFVVVNFVSRTPLGQGPFALMIRAGAGPTVAHAETEILHQPQEQYEYAGMGLDAAAGLDTRIKGWLSLVTEYKFTYAKPEITMAYGGTGQTTAATHQFAFGLAFNLSR
jgi:hypothetical protein